MRRLGGVALVVAAIYLGFLVYVYTIMRRPPEQFARQVARMPGPAFLVLPFETLWTSARSGSLRPGDEAPDFDLQTVDKAARVKLSDFRGKKPVVLVFGSYT
jgi:hypothetical protein